MNIDIVIIGLNTSATLGSCLDSVFASHYRRGELRVIYVDSGSTDGSVDIARARPGVKVIELDPKHPSPGQGRNAGWRAGSAPLVQFLDADTVMDADWLDHAADALGPEVGAVRGHRRESHPEASVFNWIADQEWNAAPGECADFGGDVLVRRSVLETTGGYDEVLVGGEDPELSQRVRKAGWKILQLNQPMTKHDLNMKTIPQYWKRAYRTGYGFAAVARRHGKGPDPFWLRELIRIFIRGGLGPALVLAGLLLALLLHPSLALLALPGFGLVLFPRLLRVGYFAAAKSLNRAQARTYAWHCSAVVVPECLGAIRYGLGSLFGHPLHNRRPAAGAMAAALTAGLFLTSCASSGFKAGMNDFSVPDRISQQKDFNVGGAFEAETEKEAQTFASESELKRFSDSVPEEYFVGPGDIMNIQVRERPEISVKEATVSPDGMIAVPQAGILNVRGMTTAEVTTLVVEKLSTYYEKPDVTVMVQEYNNNKVFVLGRVEKPGLVKFGGTGTLLEALAMSGGLPTVAEEAFLSRAMIFRGEDMVVWVNLRELLQNGNVAMNPKLKNNDIVFIPESDDELVYVMGEVKSPGAVRLKTELSVLDAVMASGGPTRDAKASKTYLIRFKNGRGHVQPVDMDRFAKVGDLRQDYLLEDGDIIYVSSRTLADINYVITKLSPSVSYLNLAALAVAGL